MKATLDNEDKGVGRIDTVKASRAEVEHCLPELHIMKSNLGEKAEVELTEVVGSLRLR